MILRLLKHIIKHYHNLKKKNRQLKRLKNKVLFLLGYSYCDNHDKLKMIKSIF